MTITTTVQCDAFSCCAEREIEGDFDSSVSAAGWHVDPHYGDQHYCPRCWPEVKKEVEEENAE